MNFVRSGLLLLLLGTGITLILLSRCVEKAPPPPPASENPASHPAPAPAPLQGRTGRPSSRPGPGKKTGKPAPSRPPRTRVSLRRETYVRGRVVDEGGLPVEGARVEALDRPPASAWRNETPPLFMETQEKILEEEAGIEDFDSVDLAERVSRRIFRTFLPSGPLEPHALSDKDGRFRLGPLARASCWLRARKGNLATAAAVPALPGKPTLLVLLPSASLKVTVLGPEGKPLPDCLVRLADRSAFQQFNQGGTSMTALTYLEGKTGTNGTFTFLGLRPPGPYLALALPKGLAASVSQPVFLARGRSASVTLRVRPGGGLVLHVRDERKKPLPGIQVRIFPTGLPPVLMGAVEKARASTGPEGEVAFHGLLPGDWVAQAYGPGLEPGSAVFTIRAGKTTRKEIILTAGAAVSGLVKNEEGAPIENALVGFTWNLQGFDLGSLMSPLLLLDPRTATRTGPKGEFTLSGLPKRPCTLAAWARGYAATLKKGIRPGRKRKVTITLMKTGAVEGIVVDPGGKPVPRFSVQAWRDAMMGLRRRLVSARFASKEGKFRLDGIPPGPFLLTLRAEGLAPEEVPDLEIESGETLKLRLPIQLHLPALVEGKVVDRGGNPVPGARVRLFPLGKTLVRVPGFSAPAPAAWTGAEGRFRLEGLPPGKWKIEADAGPRGVAEREKPLETQEGVPIRDLLLVLQPPASLEGMVYTLDGSPGKDTPILLQRIQGGGFTQKWSRTDERGKFFAPNLAPGTWQVITMGGALMKNAFSMQEGLRKKGKIDLKGIMDQSRIGRIHLAAGEKGTITLGAPAGPSGSLEGLVTAAGKPLDGALVTVVPMGKEEKKLFPRMTSTGKDGRFRMDHLSPGKYVVLAMTRTTGGTQAKRTVLIRPGETSEIRVAFGGGRIRGRLSPRGKCAGLGGRIVFLRREGSNTTMGSAVTGGKGDFQVDSLAPGTYRVYVRPIFKPAAGEPVGRSEPFQVTESGRALEVIVPVQASAEIQGSLEPLVAKGVVVEARVEGWPEPFRAETDASGLFRIGGIPPGKTRLEARSGKLHGSLEILTAPGETTRVVIHLQG